MSKKKKPRKHEGIPLESLISSNSFRRNFKMLRKELPGKTDPKLVEALNNMLLDQSDMLLGQAERGRQFKPGRAKGTVSAKTQHIRDLVAAHPNKRAKEMFRIADQGLLGTMTFSTFEKQVSAARKLLK